MRVFWASKSSNENWIEYYLKHPTLSNFSFWASKSVENFMWLFWAFKSDKIIDSSNFIWTTITVQEFRVPTFTYHTIVKAILHPAPFILIILVLIWINKFKFKIASIQYRYSNIKYFLSHHESSSQSSSLLMHFITLQHKTSYNKLINFIWHPVPESY